MASIRILICCIFLLTVFAFAKVTITEPLYFSNYPESINFPQKIFSEITNLDNVRFHYYHVNNTPKSLNKLLRITNRESTTANIKILTISNTNLDGSKLSFQNTNEFWQNILEEQLESIKIPPFNTKVIKKEKIFPENVNHGIIKISNPQKKELLVDLTYKGPIYNDVPINTIKPVIFDTIIKKEIIVLPNGPKIIIPIGHKDQSKYSYNHGNYGQIHEIHLKFINPYDYPLKSVIRYHRISGMSRNNIVINDQIYRTKFVLIDDAIEKIKTITVPPNSTPKHILNLFPESGNYYPIEIVISSLKKS